MFTHPSTVCMTYLEHGFFSLSLACMMWVGAWKAVVHAVWPDVYVTSTSDLLIEMQQKMAKAGCQYGNEKDLPTPPKSTQKKK